MSEEETFSDYPPTPQLFRILTTIYYMTCNLIFFFFFGGGGGLVNRLKDTKSRVVLHDGNTTKRGVYTPFLQSFLRQNQNRECFWHSWLLQRGQILKVLICLNKNAIIYSTTYHHQVSSFFKFILTDLIRTVSNDSHFL